MNTENIWDKNWKRGLAPDVHPELINLIKRYSPGKKILEIGFGTGGDLLALSKLAFECFGLEKSRVSFESSKKNKGFKSVFGDGESAPFSKNEFDLIFHQGVVEHFRNPRRLMSEHNRMLKDGGVIVIDVPHKWNLFTIYRKIYQLFGKWYGGWERSYSASELNQLADESGFEPIGILYRDIFPHQWSKFLFPEKIVKNKIAEKILTKTPVRFIQKMARWVYDNSEFIRLISHYNIVLVAKKRKKVIGFDGRYAEGDLVGVGKYIQNLVAGVAKNGYSCVVFYSRKPKVKIPGTIPVVLNSLNRYHFEQVLLPFALKKYKVDFYHATGNVGIPFFCPVPAVLTVHDIIPLEIKGYFSYSPFPILSKLSYTSRLKSSLAKATKIVTDSLYVKESLIKRLDVPSNKIGTIYLGSPISKKPAILPKMLLGKKYILNQGGIDIRKNLDNLIRAFAFVNIKHPDIKLVITGRNPRMKKDLDLLVENMNLQKQVIFVGYVDDGTFAALVKSAVMICYPTLSEGFGFSVLEGFGAGVPVISSNVTSIPEVAGDAAILVNPESIAEITNAMEKVLSDPNMARKMVLRGKEHYNKFSWYKTIDEYLNLYNHI